MAENPTTAAFHWRKVKANIHYIMFGMERMRLIYFRKKFVWIFIVNNAVVNMLAFNSRVLFRVIKMGEIM